MPPSEVFRKHDKNGSRDRRTSPSPYRHSRRDPSTERHVEFKNNHLVSAQSDYEYCLEGKIDGVPGTATALLDSGSNANVMSSRFFEKNVAPLHVLHSTGHQAVAFNGSSSSILGTYETELMFDKTTVPVSFEIVKDIKYDAMLGRDFLDKNVECVNTKNSAIKFNDGTVVSIVRKNIESAGGSSSAFGVKAVSINNLRAHHRGSWFRSRYRLLPTNWRNSNSYAY